MCYEYVKYLEKEGTKHFRRMVNTEIADRERAKKQIAFQYGAWNAETERQYNMLFEDFDEWIEPFRQDLYKTYIKPRQDMEKIMTDLFLPLNY